MKVWLLLPLWVSVNAWAAPESTPMNCSCSQEKRISSCGVDPAFLLQDKKTIERELGFDVPGDNVKLANTTKGFALYLAFANFLEKSDRARLYYPEFYTRAVKDASTLNLKSKFIPKNATETDEYFRCTNSSEKYCLYRNSLRPYIALAAKTSGISYAFLACQAFVESRFVSHARSSVGAVGYSQIQPMNVSYMNEILARAIRTDSNRKIASTLEPRMTRINQVHLSIAKLWHSFWKGTKNAPKNLCENDLTCYRHTFLAQALSLKVDMLALATSSSGLKADFDEQGDFRIEGMDKADSLLLLAGSYNVGVTKMIGLISRFCSGTDNLKDCLDHMKNGTIKSRDVPSMLNYIMRIRDCAQQFSAEQIDFDDDQRWTEETRTEKQNQQRDEVTQCLMNPCPYFN